MLYRLAAEPVWYDLTTLRPLAYRVYRNGQLAGHRGINVPGYLPVFPDHPSAIRAQLERRPMPDLARHTPLTAAEVLDLRVASRAVPFDPGLTGNVFVIGYNAGADVYILAQSSTGAGVTAHRDIAVIGALLRGERFEPGFIRRVLDPGYAPDELALDADAREQARRTRAAADAQARWRAREAAEAAAARARLTPAQEAPADLSASDLFSDLA